MGLLGLQRSRQQAGGCWCDSFTPPSYSNPELTCSFTHESELCLSVPWPALFPELGIALLLGKKILSSSARSGLPSVSSLDWTNLLQYFLLVFCRTCPYYHSILGNSQCLHPYTQKVEILGFLGHGPSLLLFISVEPMPTMLCTS